MEQYKVDIGGSSMKVIDYPGEKGPIVMVHGLTGTHRNFFHYVNLLKEDYRILVIDLRGRGDSDAAVNSTLFKHAEDVMKLLDILKINDPILMGHSMGAFIISIIASKRKDVKAAIYLDGAGAIDESLKELIKPSVGRISQKYLNKEDYIADMKFMYSVLGIKWDEEVLSSVEYEIELVDDVWVNRANEKNVMDDLESFHLFNPKIVAEQIECPVLLVCATGDIGPYPPLFAIESFEDTKKYTKNIKTITTPSNHYTLVGIEQPEINEAIIAFLNKYV